MQIPSRFTIALHILACAHTFAHTRKVTSAVLAESTNVNAVIIRNILSQLKNANLIQVARGTGGTVITRDPQDILLLDVYKAVECVDAEGLFHVHKNPNPQCPVGKDIRQRLDCQLHDVQQCMEDKLASLPLTSIF